MQAIWFVINAAFVAVLIAMLFSHRALTEAQTSGAEIKRVGSLKRRRNMLAVLTIVLFAAMCVSFVLNMKING